MCSCGIDSETVVGTVVYYGGNGAYVGVIGDDVAVIDIDVVVGAVGGDSGG